LTVDSASPWSGSQDKGHTTLVAAFARSLDQGSDGTTIEQSLASSRATLAALGSVLDGRPAILEHDAG
jgi:hypothetical protein